MDKRGGWRHELEFVCTLPQLIIIENRIRPLLRQDPHAGRAGMYSVRSVYFDDPVQYRHFAGDGGGAQRNRECFPPCP